MCGQQLHTKLHGSKEKLEKTAKLNRHADWNLQTARQKVWPTAVQLQTELYGSKEGLERTATLDHRRHWTLQTARHKMWPTAVQQQSSYKPNCTAARKDWRERPHLIIVHTGLSRQHDTKCGQQQSIYKPNCTAARRNWRK